MTESENKAEPAKAEERSLIEKATLAFTARGGTIKKSSAPSASRKVRRQTVRDQKKANRTVGKRRPILSAWSMLKVKKGTVLYWKADHKVTAKTISDVTMEMEVQKLKGRSAKRFLGLMKSEAYVRGVLGCPVKSPQGWGAWGILNKKGEFQSIYSIYDRMV